MYSICLLVQHFMYISKYIVIEDIYFVQGCRVEFSFVIFIWTLKRCVVSVSQTQHKNVGYA